MKKDKEKAQEITSRIEQIALYGHMNWADRGVIESMIAQSLREFYNEAIADVIELIENHEEKVCVGVINDIENLYRPI